ncbi:MOSC domain-containing protein [Catellatospora chokoriensis]|uniref:MOSC domain-containing protein n=1 Tax=Catellatospora chokoriensis TaxID=310353 RepID=A0A8J3NRW5_9ACTN|nr:hypothetical protein [Catellatospora chokoriensis]GIF89848.1 hypothetical protein Cch02nite_32920 [Catellatospora chokoriensis]
MSTSHVSQLFIKLAREADMTEQTYLDVDPVAGILRSLPTSPPRQVNITTAGSLQNNDVSAAGSRANIIISGEMGSLRSGARVTIGQTQMRITFPCEPCAHGARLAGTPLGRFRQLDRHLAVITSPGRIGHSEHAAFEYDVYPPVPGDFKARAAWAVGQIPAGTVVRSPEFLTAIGASRSYHRALPGWLRQAVDRGLPGHRVLPADLAPPSWSPEAVRKLADEGLHPGAYGAAIWPLVSALWSNQTSAT